MRRNIITILIIGMLAAGCGSNDSERNGYLKEVPDPERFFTEAEFSKYYAETLGLKGIKVDYLGDDLENAYKDYIKECENSGIWVNPVFVSDDRWCYQDEDKSLQIVVNMYENSRQIDIAIKTLKED